MDRNDVIDVLRAFEEHGLEYVLIGADAERLRQHFDLEDE